MEYRILEDGNAWCAVDDSFVDLQNSEAGFGDTPVEALQKLLGTFGWGEPPQNDQQGYYGHEAGCDCAVCDDIAFREATRGQFVPEPDAQLKHYEAALIKIARARLEPAHLYEQALMLQSIAHKALEGRDQFTGFAPASG